MGFEHSSVSVAADGSGVPEELVFGQSPRMLDVRRTVEKVAGTNLPVLICGESGTGKEVLAKVIHDHFAPGGPFVKINCPAIPGPLLESELFGYERGSFTGAYASKPGLVELAHNGTLFLDEIAELDTGIQAKLLQLLQDGSFTHIGGQSEQRVEVRVICATNRLLEREIAAGTFRQDLFYRINVVRIELPPLRDRAADLPALLGHFLALYSKEYGTPVEPPSRDLIQVLSHYHWPGNVRELQNLARKYVILGSEEAVLAELLNSGQRLADNLRADSTLSLKSLTRAAVRDLERRIILHVLSASNWNRKEAARMLKISYRALFYKMKEAGVPPKRMLHEGGPQAEGRRRT